jgi:glycosyltransferase involved in cell wall biosynthesis
MASIKGILILTPFFSPNIGGTERQLDDLTSALDGLGYKVYVQTYSPLTTQTPWLKYEKRGKNIFIIRYHWLGKNIFHKVEKFPFLSFIYLTPYLFIRAFIWLLLNKNKITTIHAQGLNASLIGVVFSKIFNKKLITSIHAVYEINPSSFLAKLNYFILKKSDKILATSQRSLDELESFGIERKKLDVFIPWIDQKIFKPYNRYQSRQDLGLENIFTVFFLSRLIKKKGARVLIKVAKLLPYINFVFAGIGPESGYISNESIKHKNIIFAGTLKQSVIPKYFSAADIYCFPTQYEEGFGLVLAEALSCGTPIITSNLGAIPKVVDSSVAVLVKPTVTNLKNAIIDLYSHPKKLSTLRSHTLTYAKKHFSSKNVLLISRYY